MADDEVAVKISADDTGLQQGFDSAQDRTKKFAGEQERQADKAAKAWTKASKLVGQALVGFAAAGVAGFAVAGKSAADFESPMRRVNTMAKLNEEQFKKLKLEVQGLSDRMKTTQSADKMATALYDIYGAGLEGEKALKTLEAATVAADAGASDLATTASVLTSAMIAYNLPAEKAGYVSDLLFKTVDKGKVSFSELASSIGPVLTVASKFGVSMEEVGAAYAQLSLTASSPAEAATALERAIVQLAAPTPDVVKKLDSLGVSYGRNALQAKGFLGVLREWTAASGGSDSELRRMLSSSEALKVGLDLAAEGGAGYIDKLQAMGLAAGSAADANAIMAKDFAFSWDVLAKEVKNASIKVGEVLLPLGTQILQFGADAVHSFNTTSEGSRQMGIGLGAGVIAISGLTGAAFLLAPQIAAMPKVFGMARTAAAVMAGVLTSELVVGVLAVVSAMTLLSEGWEKNWGGMRTTAITSAKAIKDAMISMGLLDADPLSMGQMPGNQLASLQQAGRDARPSVGRLGSGQLAALGQAGQAAQPAAGIMSGSQLANLGKAGKTAQAKAQQNPEVQRLLAMLAQQDAELRRIMAAAKAQQEEANKKTKERTKSEDELRLAMVAQAKALVSAGTSTAEVKQAMGNVGKESEQCANTMRLISQKAGLVFPTDLQPFDKQLLRAGEGVGPAMADSLFGGKVGSFNRDPKRARAGDLAFYDSPNRPGVVQHVEMVDDQGGTIGASSSSGKVVQRRGLGDLGADRRLIGFISPSVYKGKGAGAQAGLGGDESEYLEVIKKRRQDFLDFIETDMEKSARELYDDYQAALKGARNPQERAKLGELYGQKRNDLEVENNTSEGQLIGFGREMGAPDAAREMLQEMVDRQREAYEERKLMGVNDTQARIAEIAAVLQSDMLAHDTRKTLEAEKYQLQTDYQQLTIDNADQRVERALQDLEFERETGQITLAEKLARLQQETVGFAGSLQVKRQLLQELHQTEMQMEAERNAMADQVFQNIEQGFQGMLQQALSSQQSFSQTFSSLWKSLANQVLAELAKMIIKALALQAILRGIFGFFGGIFGGITSAASGIGTGGLDLVGGAIGIAHTGGVVVPGGIATFHRGGAIGRGLRPDEVLAKLQVGETILSQDHVAAIRSAPAPGGGAYTYAPTQHFNVSNEMDLERVRTTLARDFKRGMAEQR